MKLSDHTRKLLKIRREARDMKKAGYTALGLTHLDSKVITDVVIGASGRTLYLKTSEKTDETA